MSLHTHSYLFNHAITSSHNNYRALGDGKKRKLERAWKDDTVAEFGALGILPGKIKGGGGDVGRSLWSRFEHCPSLISIKSAIHRAGRFSRKRNRQRVSHPSPHMGRQRELVHPINHHNSSTLCFVTLHGAQRLISQSRSLNRHPAQ
jgi:hypothetical protein